MIRTITIFFILIMASIKTEAQLANGFIDQVHSDSWQNPTGLTFDAAGKMYVWEKDGKVYIWENNVKTLFIDISEEVATYGDYGILGFTLDPNFMSNGHVYLYYIVDRYYLLFHGTQGYEPSESWDGATIGRVTRFTTPNPTTPTTVDYSSRFVLIGEDKSTGFPITGTNHGGGGMAFGNDGTLFISCGDGGLGNDFSNDALNDGILSPAENIDRPYRCQMINSLNGKIVRINPITGDGIDGNPFFDPNSPRSAQSRVWALGFRNPFRFTVKPNSGYPGVLYVGDVGWNNREEIDIVTAGGQNFGWPAIEGMDFLTFYTDPVYAPENPKKPTIEWRDPTAKVLINNMVHEVGSSEFPGANFAGTCSIGGIWYSGTNFPQEYQNTYLFADFLPGWIKSFSFDGNENPTSFRDLSNATGAGVIGLAQNPIDGAVYYIKIALTAGNVNEIHKISYGSTNVPPVAKFTYNPANGTSPLAVSFDASSSTDLENSALSYTWNFGDGNNGSGVNISHTFDNGSTNPQKYEVFLTVTDDGGLSSTTSAFVSLNNTPPIITSTSVDAINTFANNGTDLIQLLAQVSDNEEPSGNLFYRWVVRLYHDDHSHPELDVTRATSQINLEQVPCDGHLYFYKVTLTVSDSYGLSTTYSKDIYPNCIADVIPPEPPLLKSYDNTSYSFKLSWNSVFDNVGVNSYEVFINGASQGLLNAQTVTYQYNSATSIENQSYECYVKVKDLAGNENSSSKINFTISGASSGEAMQYLSNLTPSSSSNGFGPIEIDHSNGGEAGNDGAAIILNGITYSNGFGVHANSEIIFDLSPNTYNTFSTKIGIDDEIWVGDCGTVIFKIYKDNVLAYESPVMYPASETIYVQIDITNTTQLKLVVENAGDNSYCDHADWADAKLFNLIPPATTLSYVQSPHYFQINWIESVMIDNLVNSNTYNLQRLASSNYIISTQAKVDSNSKVKTNPCPSNATLTSPIDNYSNNTITLKTSDIISAKNIIYGNSKVIYQAANKIELLPGFSATAGSIFKAQIQGCDN